MKIYNKPVIVEIYYHPSLSPGHSEYCFLLSSLHLLSPLFLLPPHNEYTVFFWIIVSYHFSCNLILFEILPSQNSHFILLSFIYLRSASSVEPLLQTTLYYNNLIIHIIAFILFNFIFFKYHCSWFKIVKDFIFFIIFISFQIYSFYFDSFFLEQFQFLKKLIITRFFRFSISTIP